MKSQIGIFGLGVEGVAAAEYFLKHTDFSLLLIDRENPEQKIDLTPSQMDRVEFCSEATAVGRVGSLKTLLRSPGISPSHPIVSSALQSEISVTTPTGWWLEHVAPAATVTVTGTKGKSSTSWLIAHLFRAFGLDSVALGNIGKPPLSADNTCVGIPVIEMSSYMMHDIPHTDHFHVVTNLFREHTAWHGSQDAYWNAKVKPFHQASPAKGLAPQSVVDAMGLPTSVKSIESLVQKENQHLSFDGMTIEPQKWNEAFKSEGELLALQAAVSTILATRPDLSLTTVIESAIKTYAGLPHRQQVIPTTDDRIWVDDSLATVPEATIIALDRWRDSSITLVLGGADRGQDFHALSRELATRPNVTPVVFGSVRNALLTAFFEAKVTAFVVGSFEDALAKAASMSPPNGVVLFSPAAASEPPHGNYKVRAEIFKTMAQSVSD